MPGFYIYTGNRTELLADKLCSLMKSSPLSPFEPERIVVQNLGTARWLSRSIAARDGICANIDFPFPKHFAKKIFSELIELPEKYHFSPEAMTWNIMKILPGFFDDDDFAALKYYCSGENSELKLFQLAERISSVFDSYLIFRPEMILSWDAGENLLTAEHARWQFRLWRRLSVESGQQDTHLAALKRSFLNKIAEGFRPEKLPPRIFVFGISALPPFYIDIFRAISLNTDVHFFYTNPCREYWDYIYSENELARLAENDSLEIDLHYEKGNMLLASFGRAGREFFSILNGVPESFYDDSHFQEPGTSTMLSTLQSDILNLRDRGTEDCLALTPSGNDRSIQIHSCHSRFRELEVLYQNLLAVFDSDHSVKPDDIIVMAPDISEYAPLVEAVFDCPESPEKKIPYSLADSVSASGEGIGEAFIKIISLPSGRYTSKNLLDILDCCAVHEKFKLRREDLPFIRKAVSDSGIRWGTDADFRKETVGSAFGENSWISGIERMLLGYAMPEQYPPRLFSDILPYDREGEASLVLGRFIEFVKTVFKYSELISRPHSIASWSEILNRVLNDFFDHAGSRAKALSSIRGVINEDGLVKYADISGFDSPVSPALMNVFLKGAVQNTGSLGGYLGGGVTFCSMQPMRSIPFKVICLLGMDDGAFPRVDKKQGFDLMSEKRKPCDSSRRFSDRYLFLETLLSARDIFIISYNGRSIKDNEILPPSPLVSELLDCIRQSFSAADGKDIAESIIFDHPLQHFNRRYFEKGSKLFSYSGKTFEAVMERYEKKPRARKIFMEKALDTLPSEFMKVSPESFVSFFRRPAEYFLKNRMNVKLELKDETPEEAEALDVGGLGLYQLKTELARRIMSGADVPERETAIIYNSLGILPPGEAGRDKAAEIIRDVSKLCERFRSVAGDTDKLGIDVDFESGGVSVKGVIRDYVPDRGIVLCRCSKLKGRHKIEAWILHLLAAVSMNDAVETYLICEDKSSLFKPLSRRQAEEELSALTELYIDGMKRPLPFFPETSLAYAEKILKGERIAADLSAAGEWNQDEYNHIPGESGNPYFSKCFADYNSDVRFYGISEKIWNPVLTVIDKL